MNGIYILVIAVNPRDCSNLEKCDQEQREGHGKIIEYLKDVESRTRDHTKTNEKHKKSQHCCENEEK